MYIFDLKSAIGTGYDIGGKAESLGKMLRMGLPVPCGYVIAAQAFNEIKEKLEKRYEKIGEYGGSPVYKVCGMNVSLWEDVFSPENGVTSINYFTDGKITTNHLLVPGYEDWYNDIDHVPSSNRAEILYGGRVNFTKKIVTDAKKIENEMKPRG